MAAQAVLHREILHVHATLNLILHVLRVPLAIVHPLLRVLIFKYNFEAWKPVLSKHGMPPT